MLGAAVEGLGLAVLDVGLKHGDTGAIVRPVGVASLLRSKVYRIVKNDDKWCPTLAYCS